jgi:hypothetical protein
MSFSIFGWEHGYQYHLLRGYIVGNEKLINICGILLVLSVRALCFSHTNNLQA